MAPARRPRHELALGIDIGGTGVKAALVDVATGELRSARVRRKTPQPSTPEAVAATTRDVFDTINEEVPIPDAIPVGAGLPGVIKNGQLTTAANIDQGWLSVSAGDVLGEAIGRKVVLINDADAAGLAEMRFGAGRGQPGTVLLLTIGTGIGSAIFIDGRLLDSTELGHYRFHGTDAEKRLSGTARERRKLRWKEWAGEFNEYLGQLEFVLNPDLIILGGGVSKEIAKFGEFLKSKAPVVPATYLNASGIVGAAMYAAEVS